MNPVQLRDPNGNTAGYICGVCGAFPNEELLTPRWEPDFEPRKYSAHWDEMLLDSAALCCRCRRCAERPVDPAIFTDVCAECLGPAAKEQHERDVSRRKNRGYSKGRKARSLMQARDRRTALKLLAFMIDWSEEKDCAQWIDGLEHRMWSGEELTPEERDEFRSLVESAGGIWTVRFDGERLLELFISLAKWLEINGEVKP